MAQPQTGDQMSGFKLIEKRFVKEVDAECLLFEHEQSGARLFKIANPSCICFKIVDFIYSGSRLGPLELHLEDDVGPLTSALVAFFAKIMKSRPDPHALFSQIARMWVIDIDSHTLAIYEFRTSPLEKNYIFVETSMNNANKFTVIF